MHECSKSLWTIHLFYLFVRELGECFLLGKRTWSFCFIIRIFLLLLLSLAKPLLIIFFLEISGQYRTHINEIEFCCSSHEVIVSTIKLSYKGSTEERLFWLKTWYLSHKGSFGYKSIVHFTRYPNLLFKFSGKFMF